MSSLCLSIHADYMCRHSGACCSAWMVPADQHVVELVSAGRIRSSRATGGVFITPPNTPGVDLRIAHGPDGACIFRESQRCAIHAQAGVSALPVSCRHFPRVILRDRLNIRISLSHYCPTAAWMLVSTTPIEVVDASRRLTVEEPMEGLDARDALPPLLRPGLLTDLEGYNAWEVQCIATLARGGDPTDALNIIARATETARAWTPARGRLVDTVSDAFDIGRRGSRTA